MLLAVARATFLESLRDRVLYSIFLFALGMLLASAFLSSVPVGDRGSILKDFGLAGISFFGLCLSVFLGISLVSKEIERKSLYWLLVKPVSRHQLLVGKYLGLLALLLLDIQFMGALFLLQLRLSLGVWEFSLLTNVAFLFLKFSVLTAIAVAFSTFSTPTLSVLYTLVTYFIGNSTARFRAFAPEYGPGAAFAGELFYLLLPNFDNFDIRKEMLHRASLPAAQVLFTVVYALAYVFLALAVARFIFERREFN